MKVEFVLEAENGSCLHVEAPAHQVMHNNRQEHN